MREAPVKSEYRRGLGALGVSGTSLETVCCFCYDSVTTGYLGRIGPPSSSSKALLERRGFGAYSRVLKEIRCLRLPFTVWDSGI